MTNQSLVPCKGYIRDLITHLYVTLSGYVGWVVGAQSQGDYPGLIYLAPSEQGRCNGLGRLQCSPVSIAHGIVAPKEPHPLNQGLHLPMTTSRSVNLTAAWLTPHEEYFDDTVSNDDEAALMLVTSFCPLCSQFGR
jgi:hypothetical protein